MSAEPILEVVRLLEEHRRIPLYRLAKMLHTDPDTLRTQIEAFNDVEISGLVLDAAFSIEPADGWPEDGPDPEPTITDVVKFGPGMGGDSLGLRHQDAAVLGPLLSAAQQLRALEPSNLDAGLRRGQAGQLDAGHRHRPGRLPGPDRGPVQRGRRHRSPDADHLLQHLDPQGRHAHDRALPGHVHLPRIRGRRRTARRERQTPDLPDHPGPRLGGPARDVHPHRPV